MNILLVHPSSSFVLRNFSEISLPEIPIHLAGIAAVLERDGHVVRIVDLNVVETKDELVKRLEEMPFDIIGFTATTPVITSCYRAIRLLKKMFPATKIVLGGWHASALPEKTMAECPEIDFVVKGEGDITMPELVRAIELGHSLADIEGLVFRDAGGHIVRNEDRPLVKNLDDLPFPSRHLLPMDAYRRIGFTTVGGYYKKDLYITSIVTSRGCTGKCTFCADSAIYHRTCRFRSPENVVAEIKEAVEKYNARIFFIIDANFTLSPKRVTRICELIIEEGLHILWACAARVDSVNEELLRLMKRAGCVRISYGVESGSPRVLGLMEKHVSIRQIKDAVQATKRAGIPVYIYFVYGMPGETIQDVYMSRQLLMELKPDYLTQSIATPFPGSELYNHAASRGWLDGKPWSRYNYPFDHVMELPQIAEISRLQSKILIEFYTRPFFIKNTLRNMRSVHHLWFYLKAARVLLKYAISTGIR
nr:radical SAM protein [Candidatus Sigynarchaeum springense]